MYDTSMIPDIIQMRAPIPTYPSTAIQKESRCLKLHYENSRVLLSWRTQQPAEGILPLLDGKNVSATGTTARSSALRRKHLLIPLTPAIQSKAAASLCTGMPRA